MNLFKKAIVASAVVASFGASATATVSSDALELSAEGVAAELVASNQVVTIDFVVGTLTPANSTITLTFDDTISLADLETALAGDSSVSTTDDSTAGDEVTFFYGNGSFTFDRFVVDADAGTIMFDVNLGDPILANSAFRMVFNAGAGVDISGAASVGYASVDSNDVAIETGTGVIATEISQFSAAVTSDFDGIIERVQGLAFLDGAGTTAVDAAVFTLTNNQTGLAAALTVTDIALQVDGNFDNGVTGTPVVAGDFALTGAVGVPANTLDADFEFISVDTFTILNTGADDALTLTFTSGGADVIPLTGDMSATATFMTAADGDVEVEVTGSAGEWKLDATVINVPYFPVGFEGTSTSVHFANEASSTADVIVSAIDADGNEYGPLDLGMDFAGDTVTKVSQGAIMSLFGLTESAKLSVTFNIDADDGDVNAYAFTTDDTGRTEISNSQLKGIE
jgi:hypothetical protein